MEQVKAWLLLTSWYPYTRDHGLFFLNCPSFQPFKDRLCFSRSVTPFSAEKKVILIHLCAPLHPDGCRCTRWPRTCPILSCLQGLGRLLGDLSQEEGKDSPSHTKTASTQTCKRRMGFLSGGPGSPRAHLLRKIRR